MRIVCAAVATMLFAVPAAGSGSAVADVEGDRDPAAEAARERAVVDLVERWSDAFHAWVEDAAALPEAQGLLVSALRRDDDAAEDLVGLNEALGEVRDDVTVAAGRLGAARERLTAAERDVEHAAAALQRAEDAVGAQRLRMDGHAASIYKYGATQLGAIESILRSGSPTDYLAHMKMRGSVLSHDHHRYLELASERDAAALGLAETVDRRDLATRRVDRREEELQTVELLAGAVDDTVRTQQATVRAAAGAHRSQAAAVASLESAVSARVAEMIRLEEQLAQDAAAQAPALLERRKEEQARLDEERQQDHPFLDQTRFRRPLLFPSPIGFTCAVPGGQFINDWAFPRPGGRTHQGTDMFAPTGAPVLAVADGEVTDIDREDGYDGGVRGDLGGRTVSIATSEDDRWYFAHLEVIDPGLAVGDRVEAGQQIGTVGDSGNARGGPPHLHIGRYVDDIAANPWPAMHIACRAGP